MNFQQLLEMVQSGADLDLAIHLMSKFAEALNIGAALASPLRRRFLEPGALAPHREAVHPPRPLPMCGLLFRTSGERIADLLLDMAYPLPIDDRLGRWSSSSRMRASS
jgi:hypothetical protein